MYLECAEGTLKGDWYILEKMQIHFHQFCENLLGGMMKYNPKQGLFPGDDKMRAVTKMPRAIRDHTSKRKTDQVTAVQVQKAKRTKKGRLCRDSGKLCNHVSAIINLKKPHACLPKDKCVWIGVAL